MKFGVVISLAAALSPAVAAAQGRPAPFGIPMGTPISRLQKISSIGARHFSVRPPKPNPNFVRYEVTATPAHGVCAIQAFMAEDRSQEEATYSLARMAKLLSIYGPARLGDTPGDVDWLNLAPKDLPDYQERYWAGRLPNNLELVSAAIEKGPSGGFRVAVWYSYKNLRACRNWEPGQNRTGL